MLQSLKMEQMVPLHAQEREIILAGEVIKRMTRISRNKRYQNAQELLEVLDRLEGGVPGRGQPRVAPFSVRAG